LELLPDDLGRAGGGADRLGRASCGLVDVDTRGRGWGLLEVGARPVEPPVAKHDPAGLEDRSLEVVRRGTRVSRELPSNALGEDWRAPAAPAAASKFRVPSRRMRALASAYWGIDAASSGRSVSW
jgi:hypothetical protein